MSLKKRVIRFHLSGRLGNQLFEWAYMHELAAHYGVLIQPIYDSKHPIADSENIVCSFTECRNILSPKKSEIIGNLLNILDWVSSRNDILAIFFDKCFRIVRQFSTHAELVLPRKRPWLVTGFFQDAKWVLKHSDEVFKELSNEIDRHPIPAGVLQRISSIGSYQVLHVRRGDFKNYQNGFGLLSQKYYIDNIDVGLPIIICTDDVIGAQDIISEFPAATVLGPDDLGVWQTLSLMSRATTLICSNSTLSWWGGFIGALHGNRVIQPEPFYVGDPSANKFFDYPAFNKSPAYFAK